jgi:predicted unusual protein kinase regulating ubiquinone biosynthesis (AarF/ABC1/UbiB family)
LGQFIASAPSVFPKEYVEEFQKCLDATEVTDFSIIKRTIEKDLGRSIDDVFATIDPVPLASASVAQVHRATLLGSGRDVVVKVLKPNVEDTLKADLSFVLIVSKVLQFLNPELSRTSLVDIVGDIRESMLEETDFRKEAQNVDAFRRYLEDAELTNIAKAPQVYKQFSGKRVMVMEYFSGVPLTDLEAIRSVSTRDPEATLINALNVWFGSVLACESFHADVHAGNLIVCPDGRVGFIDFGIVGKISPSIWGAVQAFFQSTAARDYERMALALVTMGATDGEVDVKKFANDLRKVYETLDSIEPTVLVDEDAFDGTPRAAVAVDQQQVTQLATDLIVAAEENKIKLPKAFGILIKQLIYFDRYVQLLAPDLEVIDDDRVAFVDAVAVDVSPKRLASS